MSESDKRSVPDPQMESVKKHGDKLVPDMPRKQFSADDAEQVKGGGQPIKKVDLHLE